MMFKIKLFLKSFLWAFRSLKSPLFYFSSLFTDRVGELLLVNGMRLRYDSAGALGLIYAISHQGIYGKQFDDNIIIDIGANRGYFSVFAIKNGAKKVYAFEPMLDAVNEIRKNIGINQFEDMIEVIPLAVGSENKQNVKIYRGAGKEDSSIYNLDDKSNFTLINQKAFNEILNDIKDDKIDLLKMNCEGAEYDILLNTAPLLLKRFKNIRLEFHNYSYNGKEFHVYMIDTLLTGIGFKKVKQTNPDFKHGIAWYSQS